MEKQEQTPDNRNTVRKRLFLNVMIYLAIALALYGLVFVSFIPMRRNVYTQAEQKLANETQGMANTVDNYMERVNAACYVLMTSENFMHLLNTGWNGNENKLMDATRISNTLRNTIITNDFIKDIMVCFYGDTNVYITSMGRGDDEKWLEEFLGSEKYAEFAQANVVDERTQYTSGKMIQTEAGEVFYVKTYPVTPVGDGSIRSSIYVRLAENPFRNTSVSGYSLTDGEITVDSRLVEGSILTVMDNQTKKYMLDGVWSDFTVNSAEYQMSCIESTRIPYTYVGILPVSTLQEELQGVWLHENIVYLVLLCVLVMIIIGHMWSIFNPLNHLIAEVVGDTPKKLWLGRYFVTELQGIMMESAEQKLANQNYHKQTELEAKKRTYIAMLDNRSGDNEVIRKLSQELGLDPDRESFYFVGIRFIDMPAVFNVNVDSNEELAFNFCEGFLIKMLQENYKIIYFNIDSILYFCVSFIDDPLKNEYTDIKTKLLDSQLFLRERYAIDIQIGISNYHTGVDGIRDMYQEIRSTMEYLELTNARNIMEYSTFSLDNARNSYTADEIPMLNYIKIGEYDRAEKLFKDIVENVFVHRDIPPKEYMFELYSFMNRIMTVVNDTNAVSLDYKKLVDFKNVEEFQNNMMELFEQLKGSEVVENEDSEKDFVRKVCRIVDQNYANTELNVTAIAELLGKNLDYVSRVFKKMTGEGLLDYIQKVRIEKAKQIFLETPELTLQQVAGRVGYVSCESFSRVFKNKEGITPGKYRDQVAINSRKQR